MKINQLTIDAHGKNQAVVALRGIAALMVCIFHFTNGNDLLLKDGTPLKLAGYYGKWGVEIFFIISGFVIPLAMYRAKYKIKYFFTFLKKRIIRIEPPYLLSILLILLLGYISSIVPGYKGKPFFIDWWNVAGHIAYLNVFNGARWLCDAYWTLAIEFQYYLLVAALFYLITSVQLWQRLIFFILFTGVYYFHIIDNRFIFFFSAYFSVGILLFQYASAIIKKIEFVLLLSIALFLIFWVDGSFLLLLTAGTIIVFFVVTKIASPFKYLGLISYSLYLTHIPVGGRVINFTEAHSNNITVRILSILLALLAAAGFSALFYWLIERRSKLAAAAIRYNMEQPDK